MAKKQEIKEEVIEEIKEEYPKLYIHKYNESELMFGRTKFNK
jgi:predicted HTH domain antitoxin